VVDAALGRVAAVGRGGAVVAVVEQPPPLFDMQTPAPPSVCEQ